MGFFGSRKGSIISDYFKLDKSIGVLQAGDMHDVALFNDYLSIKSDIKKQEITLNYSQITDVYYGIQEDIIIKNKSSIGRAVAGGILFAGVGAIVGAVSGTGSKEVKKKKFVLVVSYISAGGSEDFIAFEDTRMYKGAKVAKKLTELSVLDKQIQPESKISL